MSKEFDNILNECLEQLLLKGATIEQCLQSYPEQAVSLKPLLETALATMKAVAIQPSAEFKARARYQFRSALQEAASQRKHIFLDWLPRWATVVTMVLGIFMVGGGTVAAASYSMPDSLLYPVKLATEQVQLALTPSDNGKAKLNTEFADRRVTEIIYTASKGDVKKIEAVTQRLDKRLTMLARLTSVPEAAEAPRMMESATPPMLTEETESSQELHSDKNNRVKLRTTVAHYAIHHPAGLRAALEKAPESAKPALRRAIAISEAGYKKALKGWD
ncbi:DUF5667 domain-containing protein [Chloroflexota bacterium]